jgi:hypothetical protein
MSMNSSAHPGSTLDPLFFFLLAELPPNAALRVAQQGGVVRGFAAGRQDGDSK